MNTKLSFPLKNFNWIKNISQLFGVNAQFYQEKLGQPAHNGLDCIIRYKEDGTFDPKLGYGTPILAAHNGIVEKIKYDVPHKSRGNSIELFDESGAFSTIYLHLSGFQCNIGNKIKAGQVIGLLGNSGFTTPVSSPENPFGGSHLHFSVVDHTIPNNEYGSMVDPVPYLFKIGDKLPMKFDHDLSFGMEEDAVSWLQTILKIEFPDITWQPIGFFGQKTLEAVKRFQLRYNITPAYGYVGQKTMKWIKSIYVN